LFAAIILSSCSVETTGGAEEGKFLGYKIGERYERLRNDEGPFTTLQEWQREPA
jgi:hypothetical protein